MKELSESHISNPDFTPQTPREISFFKKNDEVSAFMDRAYDAYGIMRFHGAPFMKQPQLDHTNRGEESISSHMWAVELLWEATHPIVPNLTNAVNVNNIFKYIRIHDLGEIGDGDISIVRQLNGEGKDRAKREEVIFSEITSLLPQESQVSIRQTHNEYEKEKNDSLTKNKDVLLAKILDTMQGDHFVLSQSINFDQYKDLHKKIVNRALLPYVSRLYNLLQEDESIQAMKELQLLLKHHLYQYQKRGVFIESYLL